MNNISEHEFLFAVTQNAGLPVTEGQLDDLVDMMDDDGNGEVDLALVSAFHSLKNSLFFLSLYFDTRPMSSALQLILHRERLDVNTFMLKKYSLSA